MRKKLVEQAFRAEAGALGAALAGLGAGEWARPTRCEPWTVVELLAHVRVAVGRVEAMLAGPEPERAEVTAVGYYRPDERFDAATNRARIALARDTADGDTDPVAAFERTWQGVAARFEGEAEARVVRTRHSDPMLLTEFMITRVVESAVHGLDLADALDRPAWLTDEASEVLEELLLTDVDGASVRAALGWDRATLLRKATGRAELDAVERAEVARAGITWLTLG
ncbi:maleylpyruvate isomerase N-terminal domain-containing protein [Kitasatospora griseola]|uniref:maleylpyruvate isomerase N-terminal domain-containing protein n=1 Tax=Kitasatospora griseola TaxID=2064 RepID=UPI00167002AC|nr:maleylpyruvate isomerase N-terminal domain-containing protein [Kitasatospora griseola]